MKLNPRITLFVPILLFLMGMYISSDLTRFLFSGDLCNTVQVTKLGVFFKLGFSFLCMLFVLTSRKYAWNRIDHNWLIIIFVTIFMADVLINFIDLLGIALFALVQILLIIRNLKGFKQYWLHENGNKNLFKFILIFLLILAVNYLIVFHVIYDIVRPSPLYYLMLVYLLILSISLLSAFLLQYSKKIPKLNSRMVLVGMITFFISDYTVGLNLTLPMFSHNFLISNSITWITYGIAITLIALSTHDIQRTKD